MMRGHRVLLAVGLIATAGCYSYVPTRLEMIEPGQDVRVRLSPEEADRLVEMRRSDSRTMVGTVVSASQSEVTMNTQVSRLDPMAGTRALMQTLDVPSTGIVEVELRELDNLKTAAGIGLLAVGVGVGLAAALGGDASGGDPPVPPGPEESWIPFFLRVAFPF